MIPEFYNKDKCGTLFKPSIPHAIKCGRDFVKSVGGNVPRPFMVREDSVISLFIVDNQVDFTNKELGSLYVPGSEGDTDRLNRFIFNNVTCIDNIGASLDTHTVHSVFHPSYWVHPTTGEHPKPFTEIKIRDVIGLPDDGGWLRIKDDSPWVPAQRKNHVIPLFHRMLLAQLESITIWPYHCLQGDIGSALDPTLVETLVYFASVREVNPTFFVKGTYAHAEHFSVVKACVEFPNAPETGLSHSLSNFFRRADAFILAGQAASHCVVETLEDLVELAKERGPDEVKKIYVLRDCMSSVKHPEVDFEYLTNARFDKFEKMGVNFINHLDFMGNVLK